jgi:hypothetical protein
MMPNKSWLAFVLALILMFGIIPGGMYLWFRHKGWIGSDSDPPAEK